MVQRSDLAAYLLAIKSFCAAIPVRKVIALIVRTAPSRFRRTLEAHIPGIELIEVKGILVGPCQHGGTWERLLFILDRSEHEYVVQLDADTLTLGPDLPEVAAYIAENRAFSLGGGPPNAGQKIVTMAEAAAEAAWDGDYIGDVVQRALGDYPDAEKRHYVRGSSAFAGFAKRGISRCEIEDFHRYMQQRHGPRWAEWGTEQCTSNFAIANTPGARVLPWPAYTNFQPERPPIEAARFLHFFGSVRYRHGTYARLGKAVSQRLLA